MSLAVVASSRELFGSDRAAVRLVLAISSLGVGTKLVLPDHRPERGLMAHAQGLGVAVETCPVMVATRRGIEQPLLAGCACESNGGILNSSAVLAAKGIGAPRVLMLREWLNGRSVRHRLLVRWHSARVRAVVGNSRDVLLQWKALGGTGPQFLIPDWLDEKWFDLRGSAEAVREPGLVLCVGRFNAWKGQQVLADAWAAAFGGARGAPRLVFLGADVNDPLYQARTEWFVSRTKAFGWEVVPFEADPRPWYDRASLVVVPSLHPEPFGLVVIEALARGCRVLAFPGGGPSDVSRYVSAEALTVVPRDPGSLAEALRAWADAGCGPQPSETHQATLNTLRARYSEQAGRDGWARVLAEIEYPGLGAAGLASAQAARTQESTLHEAHAERP